MSFDSWKVADDGAFSPEADPALRKAMQRNAGASIMQDVGLNTYWANTMGKTVITHPGSYNMMLKELGDNMCNLMQERMSYKQMEEFLVMLGYDVTDIRCAFRDKTGLDATKMEFMRLEDVKNTPSNIPWYNLGWGWAKAGDDQSFFIMTSGNNLYSVFHQVDDMTRKEVASFIRCEEAIDHLKSKVKKLHRYDMDIQEQIEEANSKPVKEPEKKEYRVLANYLYELDKRGELTADRATKLVGDAVQAGTLTLEEGQLMLRQADDTHSGDMLPNPQHTDNTPDMGASENPSESTDKDVKEEVREKTPQEFFNDQMSDADPERRVDEIASDHIKSVLSYISVREADVQDFSIMLHSFKYQHQDSPSTLVEVDPQTGKPSGPPKATITTILEVQDNTLPPERNRKFVFAVFSIGGDGDVTTSDSVKGEDDIVYGFSEDGLRQYFAKERMAMELGT